MFSWGGFAVVHNLFLEERVMRFEDSGADADSVVLCFFNDMFSDGYGFVDWFCARGRDRIVRSACEISVAKVGSRAKQLRNNNKVVKYCSC